MRVFVNVFINSIISRLNSLWFNYLLKNNFVRVLIQEMTLKFVHISCSSKLPSEKELAGKSYQNMSI